ncbi:putative Histidine kinase [Candidatus Desulfosporosinus infrequens]|uniref:Stage 0 sporulation protein A homolog n=1 Tax=Candidatus Desulfosporosinus infrequens TaxID=2043169 RepID=A0A2U3LKD2_9FIRM|nr:putative Histidine kinase [Candidatus Desulfosporosinus infrequens]
MTVKEQVLIIDDSKLYWMFLRKALEVTDIQAEITECYDIASGIAQLKKRSFDCIVLDYLLPDGNGFLVLQEKKNLNITTPVVVFTGQGDEQIAVDMMKAGASDYISKSTLSPERLGQCIKNVIYSNRMEETIKRSAEILKKYQILSDYARDIILFMRPDGQIFEANQSAVSTYGYSYDELTSMNIRAIREQYIDPQIAKELDLASNKGILFETIHYRKDGSSFPVEVNSQGALIGKEHILLSVIRDISKHKQAEEKYRSIFEASKDAIFITSKEGSFLNINLAGLDLFGYSWDELITMKVVAIYAEPSDRLRLIADLERKGFVQDYAITFKKKDGSFVYTLMTANLRITENGEITLQGIIRDITESKLADEALLEAHAQINHLLGSISSILIGVSPNDRINQWNIAAEKIFGINATEALGKYLSECEIKWEWGEVQNQLTLCKESQKAVQLEDLHYYRTDGRDGLLSLHINPIEDTSGKYWGYVLLGIDITEQKKIEAQLMLSQKMESIGQLAAGIAHEINTPMQYIGDNTIFLNDAFRNILETLKNFESIAKDEKSNEFPLSLNELKDIAKEIDLDYLGVEIPKAIEQSLEGINRVRKLISAMKEFSHPGKQGKSFSNINKAIEGTAIISKNEWKYVADLETQFDPNLPLVYCVIDQINQVVLNMIINSSHAIKELVDNGTISRGRIKIQTEYKEPKICITFSDTGKGIPRSIIHKIFDHFFTTKEVGKGTGQGLAIAHDIIVNKHHGSIEVNSEEGRGTSFTVTLPVESEESSGVN